MNENQPLKILILVEKLSKDEVEKVFGKREHRLTMALECRGFTEVDLDLIDRYGPDMVFLDTSIPKEERESSIRKMRGLCPDLPVLLLADPGGDSLAAAINELVSKNAAKSPTEEEPIDFRKEAKSVAPRGVVKRLLVVDDNEDDRDLLRRALRSVPDFEYKISEASSGDEGLRILSMDTQDCVILDYSLPGRDGLAVLREMRDRFPDTPVVFLTGYGNQDVAVNALKLGAQDYISKSIISGEILHQTILNACERQALTRQVTEQKETLEIFTRALAHDLKEPIRSILSFMELLGNDNSLTAESRNYTRISISTAEHMERLVDMVRDYTRLDEAELSENRSRCPASKLVEQALDNLSRQLSESKSEIVVEELPWIDANQPQIVALFQNLISNALNFGDKDVTKVWISAKVSGGQCVFTVKDNGPGVSPEMGGRIFKPFKRLSDGYRRGTGLGLSICRKIVHKNGGDIWLAPDAGDGATFHFTLPVAASPESRSPENSGPSEARGSGASRIANVLHVEDNPHDILLTKMMLEKLDHLELNIATVNNGAEALSFLEKRDVPPIDLIFLDINMPVMDGFEFLERVKKEERFARIPIIVCSTSSDEQDKRSAKNLGAQGYITKPIRLSNLEPTIRPIKSIKLSREDEHVKLIAR